MVIPTCKTLLLSPAKALEHMSRQRTQTKRHMDWYQLLTSAIDRPVLRRRCTAMGRVCRPQAVESRLMQGGAKARPADHASGVSGDGAADRAQGNEHGDMVGRAPPPAEEPSGAPGNDFAATVGASVPIPKFASIRRGL
jgi:hypothetical protein